MTRPGRRREAAEWNRLLPLPLRLSLFFGHASGAQLHRQTAAGGGYSTNSRERTGSPNGMITGLLSLHIRIHIAIFFFRGKRRTRLLPPIRTIRHARRTGPPIAPAGAGNAKEITPFPHRCQKSFQRRTFHQNHKKTIVRPRLAAGRSMSIR